MIFFESMTGSLLSRSGGDGRRARSDDRQRARAMHVIISNLNGRRMLVLYVPVSPNQVLTHAARAAAKRRQGTSGGRAWRARRARALFRVALIQSPSRKKGDTNIKKARLVAGLL